ncbi:MAG: amino acid adenylation domain-containing protein, partial [Bacteroidota bacterium]
FQDTQTAYNVNGLIRLDGQLDAMALEKALWQLIDRHEILRTNFAEINGEARQIIHRSKEFGFKFRTIDLSGLKDPERSCRKRLGELVKQPYNLKKDPLIRAGLWKIGEQKHILLISLHHIVFDGWSMPVLFRDISAYYNAQIEQVEAQLPPLNIQYKDYAHWANEQAAKGGLEASKEFWLDNLSGELPILNLPFDHPRPPVQTFEGANATRLLKSALVDPLFQLGQQNQSGKFATLTTMVNVLLYCLTRQKDIILGAPLAGRENIELENQVGYYAKTLVLRNKLDSNDTLKDLFSKVRQTTLDAFRYSDFPFDKLVEALGVERDLSRAPIFDVWVQLAEKGNTIENLLQFKDLQASEYTLRSNVSKFDLGFFFVETEEGIVLELEYNTSLFKAETIQRMLKYLEQLMWRLLEEPTQKLEEVSVLTSRQRAAIISHSTGEKIDYPKNICIPELFAEQVARTPKAVALRCCGNEYTYKQLDKITNQIAHTLKSKYDIGKESVVGLYMERSEWYVIGLLSILKAQAAFLPIGTNLPEDRIQYMIDSAKAKLVLATGKSPSFDISCPTFDLLKEETTWKKASAKAPKTSNCQKDLAYVLFTSGTTGYPKGAMVEQAGLINHMHTKIDCLQLGNDSVIALTASISFDVAIWQSLTALICGGCTQVYKEETVLNPLQLIRNLNRDRVDVLQVVPSYLAEVLSMLESDEELPQQIQLSCLVSAGEILKKSLVERWFVLFPDIPVLNAYGPTEASDIITHYKMDSVPDTNGISIGRPLPNIRVYVLDEYDRICPLGVQGEICVAGLCVSRGYINQAELNAKVFATDPYQKRKKVRLYRTGDLGRYLSDGNIELSGRKDHQLKIRGYRIELGEIEEYLVRVAGVQSGAVVAKEGENGDRFLCAYVQRKDGHQVTTDDIRLALSSWLTAYMVPEVVLFVDEMPRTATGKIDRKSLQKRVVVRASNDQTFEAATTPTERILHEIWCDVLGLEQISILDDFFHIGGNSLKAIRVQAAVHQQWKKEVSFADFFRHPDIRSFAHYLDQQSETAFESIPLADKADLYPLSPAQRRLWVLAQFEHNKTAYNLTHAFRLDGALNKEALLTATTRLIERHESLRTRFVSRKGEPFQQIVDAATFEIPLQYEELSSAIDPMVKCLQEIETEAQHAFDLAKDSLLRIRVWKMAEDQHVLLFNIHHIITDAWSMKILIDEWTQQYQSIVNGQALEQTALPIQYKDYAAWINTRLSTGQLAEAADYWTNCFAGELPRLDLPLDFNRPSIRTFAGKTIVQPLEAKQYQRLKAFGKERQLTVFTTLSALVNTLLFHLTGQEDIVVGTTIAGRNRQELQEQIGFYINTLALRTTFKGSDDFESLLDSIQANIQQAFRYQDYPFDELVEAVVTQRDASRAPLFDVLVEHLGAEITAAPTSIDKLQIEDIELENDTSKFDLSFRFIDELDTTVLYLEYNSNLFSESSIVRWMSMFNELLDAVLKDSKRPLADFDLMPPTEFNQLLQWNKSSVGLDANCRNLKSGFEFQVAFTPNKTAIIHNNQSWTYAQLNEQANRLAHQLINDKKVEPGQVVALFADRSPAFLAGLLAVVKTGAAFLPIDPTLPDERIRYLLQDAGAKLVLTDTVHMFDLTLLHTGDIAILEDLPREMPSTETENPTVDLLPSHTAYVLYTSGSTGQPKGVEVRQSNIAHYIDWANGHYFNADENYPMPLFTSVAFDLTLTCIFSTLLRGDSLHIYPESMPIEKVIADVFQVDSDIRAVKMTPAHVHILQLLKLEKTTVQKVILGGEAVEKSQVRTLLELNADIDIYNEYGPTETTVGCTVDQLSTEADITIGHPIARTEIYLLNAYGGLCPIGVSGEIYIGGAGVAKGYKNRPDLTADKFVPNPFNDEPDAKMYRSGDIGKWLPDGRLQYLGRADNQVKIRGHRIELGEIESALDQMTVVVQSAVLAIAQGGEKSLWAFAVTDSHADSLKKELSRQLPAYMIPEHWVILDEIPLNNNGKIDRSKLLKQAVVSTDEGEKLAARDELEESLVSIWQKTLNRPDIGIQDSFFELGGHSLKAIQMTLSIQDQLGVKVELQDVFSLQTIENLADLIRASQAEIISDIDPLPEQAHYQLSDAQRRLWVINQFEESLSAFNMHLMCRLKGALDKELLEFSLARLIQRHESLRTTFRMIDGEPRQIIQEEEEVTCSIARTDLRRQRNKMAKAKALATQLSNQAFDLSEGPLLRLNLMQLEDKDHVLVFNIHHIVSDGWSMEIITRELMQIYGALREGRPYPLPPLEVQYKDFAAWQNELLSDTELNNYRNYWLEQFQGDVPVLQIPTDHSRPTVKTYDSESVDFTLDKELTAQIQELAKREKSSTFSNLFAAVLTLMHRYSGQEDIVLGTPVAGRDHHQLRDQVGCFLNMLPIRSALSAEQSFAELAKQTAKNLLDAQTCQLYPFDRLVDDLKLERDTSRSPLFDVLVVSTDFDLVNPSDKIGYDIGMELEFFDTDRAANKYDLTFYFGEKDGEIQANLAYNTSLFEKACIHQMIAHLKNLLKALLADPTQGIGTPSYITEAEYKRWVLDFNDTVVPYAKEKTIHQLFEEQVLLRPQAPALRQEGQTVSYERLNQVANRLAHHLLASGVRLGDKVGILTDRNFGMITAMLAILKAGGTYVPIDPAYPESRQAYIIANSGIRIVLTDQDLAAADVPDAIEMMPVYSEAYDSLSSDNPKVEVPSSQLAYIIYTSGSTGRPKGVMIQHHSAVNLVSWVNDTFSVGPKDRVLLLTSMCFDLSVYDIFGLLAAGGCIVIAKYDDLRDFNALKRLLTEEKITFWDTVPTTLDYLVTELERYEKNYRQNYLRVIFNSGDWIPVKLPSRAKKFFPKVAFTSLGGATEGTVWSNYFPVKRVGNDWTSIPYGKPIDNNFFYILDANRNPVPQGVVGELYIGGVGVADGYMNAPEKTEAAFVADPFFPDFGGVMYRTGDLGRMLPDGNMEFLGRRDHQVKIRGFRVELGEIEAKMNELPQVENALITTVGTTRNDRRIAAYFTSVETAVSINEMQEHLSESLPDYMIPAYFVQMDEFPLNTNGKIDRGKLPDPGEQMQMSDSFVEASSDFERSLLNIWKELLKVERISCTDNFFQIGGNSLLAAQLVARVKEQTSLDIQLRTVFVHPTIQTMGAALDALQMLIPPADNAFDEDNEIVI